MTKIWLFDYHPAYDNLNIENIHDHERLKFTGSPIKDQWVPPKMESNLKDRPSDFLNRHNGAILLSARAKQLLENHIHPGEVEFLPLEHEGNSYFYMHVLNLVSCIDEKNCLEDRGIHNDGYLRGYKEYAFHEELVMPHRIMRVKYHEGDSVVHYPFISEHLHNAIVHSDLEGYQLIEIWDSERSWQQKAADYQSLVDEVTRSLTTTFTYKKAMKYVEHKKMTVYSERWAMRIDDDGDFLLGELQPDGTYSWMIPYYIPPILLGQVWGIQQSDSPSILNKIKKFVSK